MTIKNKYNVHPHLKEKKLIRTYPAIQSMIHQKKKIFVLLKVRANFLKQIVKKK